MIKHLVFDFGGVILDLDGVHTGYHVDLAHILGVSLSEAEKIWSENKSAVMTGKETPRAFLTRITKQLSWSGDIDAAMKYWAAQNKIAPTRIDWQLLDRIAELKDHYHIHMLTDQIPLDNGAKAWISQVECYFETILRSYEQGWRKPDLAAFHNLLHKIDATATPEEVLFIDDNAGNIEAAQSLGIRGVLYTFRQQDSLEATLQRDISDSQ